MERGIDRSTTLEHHKEFLVVKWERDIQSNQTIEIVQLFLLWTFLMWLLIERNILPKHAGDCEVVSQGLQFAS